MTTLAGPIIIIGAGRSGSSLLNAMLGAHPDIAMLGEMDFTLPALWRCAWDVSAAAHARSLRLQAALSRAIPEGAAEAIVFARAGELERVERERNAAVVRRTLQEIYFPMGQTRPIWGFKEIWLHSQHAHGWAPYDAVYPDALYVHLIRNPFEFARSVADWTRLPLTVSLLREQLTAWVEYLAVNRARAATGRYCLLTYESLVAEPRARLTPILERVGLAWDDSCLSALGRGHVRSPRRSPFPKGAAKLTTDIANLAHDMAEFGYRAPSTDAEGEQLMGPAEMVSQIDGATWRLNPPFLADGACGWVVHLANAPDLAHLAASADDLEHPRRSPLQLLEDGKPLGPPHSLHHGIRAEGRGRYSHWAVGHNLYFSTSDNSDPNRNGRVYTIAS
jgi:hypothetical protein